jgi:ligand-binding sensor domain-containing protein/signal transduction histidine kinase
LAGFQNAFCAEAPGSDATFVSRSWRAGEGLPQDSVWAIAQTQDGYLWVGTGAGLARFDGVRFKAYGLSEGLPALYISALLADSSGALWVGTDNGLARLHRGRVQTFSPQDGVTGMSITSLAEDRDGSVWIGTPNGVRRWVKGTFQLADPLIAPSRVLAVDSTGAIYVAGPQEELLRWDGTQFEPMSTIPEMLRARPARVSTDLSGRMWVAGNGWICSLGETNQQWFGKQEGLPIAPILCIETARDGSVWAGTQDQGLYRLKPGAPSFVRVNATNRDLDAIRACHEDDEGNLWIGTRSAGLTCLRPATVAFWELHDKDTLGLPFSMTELDDSLLVSSVGRGLYRIQDDGDAEPFMRSELEPYGLRTGVVFASREGDLWVASGNRLLHAQKGKVRELTFRSGITTICQDKQGAVWFGSPSGALRKFSGERLHNPEIPLPRAILTSLAADPSGGLWVGTYGYGILHNQGKTNAWCRNAQGLSCDLIRALYCDSSGVLWVGTEGGGLSRVQGRQIRNFGKAEGLPSETILQILEDGQGYLWLGSYRGIIRISRRQLDNVASGGLQRVQSRLFGRADGMRSEQCMSTFGGAVKLTDGRLCFAAGNGVAVIDPRQHLKGNPPPRLLVEDVIADGKRMDLPPERGGAASPQPISGPPLVIGPGRSRLQIDYTALSIAAPEQVSFRHRLAGLEKEWVEAGGSRTVEYSYLPPGNYRFELTAQSGTGLWANPPLSLDLVLEPFLWQTTWFKTGSAAALVGIAVLLVRAIERRRARAQMQRFELEGAMERERARIARDIHDDLGSRVTRISMVTQQAMREVSPGHGVASHFKIISETAHDMLDRLDETVWVVNPRNDQLDRLCDYLLNHAQDFFQHTGIRCRFKVTDEIPPLPMAAETRHHVFLVVKEALNNAARHAEATEVRIQLGFSAKTLRLTITDNGRGFDAPACLALGRGLENMRSRIANLGGTLELESGPGRGSAVRMEFEISAPDAERHAGVSPTKAGGDAKA